LASVDRSISFKTFENKRSALLKLVSAINPRTPSVNELLTLLREPQNLIYAQLGTNYVNNTLLRRIADEISKHDTAMNAIPQENRKSKSDRRLDRVATRVINYFSGSNDYQILSESTICLRFGYGWYFIDQNYGVILDKIEQQLPLIKDENLRKRLSNAVAFKREMIIYNLKHSAFILDKTMKLLEDQFVNGRTIWPSDQDFSNGLGSAKAINYKYEYLILAFFERNVIDGKYSYDEALNKRIENAIAIRKDQLNLELSRWHIENVIVFGGSTARIPFKVGQERTIRVFPFIRVFHSRPALVLPVKRIGESLIDKNGFNILEGERWRDYKKSAEVEVIKTNDGVLELKDNNIYPLMLQIETKSKELKPILEKSRQEPKKTKVQKIVIPAGSIGELNFENGQIRYIRANIIKTLGYGGLNVRGIVLRNGVLQIMGVKTILKGQKFSNGRIELEVIKADGGKLLLKNNRRKDLILTVIDQAMQINPDPAALPKAWDIKKASHDIQEALGANVEILREDENGGFQFRLFGFAKSMEKNFIAMAQKRILWGEDKVIFQEKEGDFMVFQRPVNMTEHNKYNKLVEFFQAFRDLVAKEKVQLANSDINKALKTVDLRGLYIIVPVKSIELKLKASERPMDIPPEEKFKYFEWQGIGQEGNEFSFKYKVNPHKKGFLAEVLKDLSRRELLTRSNALKVFFASPAWKQIVESYSARDEDKQFLKLQEAHLIEKQKEEKKVTAVAQAALPNPAPNTKGKHVIQRRIVKPPEPPEEVVSGLLVGQPLQLKDKILDILKALEPGIEWLNTKLRTFNGQEIYLNPSNEKDLAPLDHFIPSVGAIFFFSPEPGSNEMARTIRVSKNSVIMITAEGWTNNADIVRQVRKGLNLSDAAMGGIDLNQLHMKMNISKDQAFGGVDVKFDPAMIVRIKRDGFDGFDFEIESILPLNNLPLLLGIV